MRIREEDWERLSQESLSSLSKHWLTRVATQSLAPREWNAGIPALGDCSPSLCDGSVSVCKLECVTQLLSTTLLPALPQGPPRIAFWGILSQKSQWACPPCPAGTTQGLISWLLQKQGTMWRNWRTDVPYSGKQKFQPQTEIRAASNLARLTPAPPPGYSTGLATTSSTCRQQLNGRDEILASSTGQRYQACC